MGETREVAELDRRARQAVADLDEAFGAAFDVPSGADAVRRAVERGRRRDRRWAPLVAAVLVVAALVTAGVVLDIRGDEQGTIAGEGDGGWLLVDGGGGVVVADPGALGLEIYGVARGEDRVVDVSPATFHLPVGGPDDGGWSAAVVTATTEMTDEWFIGEVVDVGGPDAVASEALGSVPRVLWRDGDVVRSLSSGRLDLDALVAVARDAVAAGWHGVGPLPGHEIAVEGPGLRFVAQFEPMTSGADTTLVSYRRDGGQGFVIAARPGTAAEWEATTVTAQRVSGIDVAGQAGLVSEHFDGAGTMEVVSWMTEGTLVRIGTYGDAQAIIDLVEHHLRPVGRDAVDRLIAAHRPPKDRPFLDDPPAGRLDELTLELMDAEGPWPPQADAVLAAVEVTAGDHRSRLAAVADGDNVAVSFASARPGIGGGGTRYALASRETWFLRQGGSAPDRGDGPEPTLRTIGGLLPAGTTVRAVRDAATGAPVDILDADRAPLADADAQLVALLLPPDGGFPALDVVIVDGDGDERRFRV